MKVYTCALLVVVLMAAAKESSAADYEYKGCYVKDDDGFPLSKKDPKMSVDMCVQHCKEQEKPYAGIIKEQCGCDTQRTMTVVMTLQFDRECNIACPVGEGTCGGKIGGRKRISVYSIAQEKRMLNLREVLGDLTDTLEKLENAYKREMGETGGFEEEMREMEDMEAEDMFEDEE
ncbi:Hypp9206 [Branchiostoma lanceolatum]|uniref:Hypp9206 protein n=1 Tax=Branchiostoma lanceolatum TaxID=7740 RepID=A0A8K0EIA0_BRALA|nr:Hypp9206 [Branchiostoma lanceolatum]